MSQLSESATADSWWRAGMAAERVVVRVVQLATLFEHAIIAVL
jgi:hypothetical protein